MSEPTMWSDLGPRDPDFLDAPGADLGVDGFGASGDEQPDDDEYDDDEEFLHG